VRRTPTAGLDVGSLQRQLKAAGFEVPGPEQVKDVPHRTEIRYYVAEDQPAAQRLARLLDAAGVSAAVKQISGKARSGHLELWLAKDAYLRNQTAK
jgi:LytR cell envelope-related transcriptional attenuator